jgi:hypothetical protein
MRAGRRWLRRMAHGKTSKAMYIITIPDANRGWQAHGRIGVTGISEPASPKRLPPRPAVEGQSNGVRTGAQCAYAAVPEFQRDANPGAAIERHLAIIVWLGVGGKAEPAKRQHPTRRHGVDCKIRTSGYPAQSGKAEKECDVKAADKPTPATQDGKGVTTRKPVPKRLPPRTAKHEKAHHVQTWWIFVIAYRS